MRHVVRAQDRELRLDRWLRREFPSLPQSFLQTQLRKRKIRLQPPPSDAPSSLQAARGNSLLLEGSVVAIDAYLFRSKLQPIALQKEQQITRRKQVLTTAEDKKRLQHLMQRIVYQDAQFVVLNKPHGLAVQVLIHVDGKNFVVVLFDGEESGRLTFVFVVAAML